MSSFDTLNHRRHRYSPIVLTLLLLCLSLVVADDVSWTDDSSLESPGCTNKFQMLDGHIALSIRGNCAFTEKAKHAEEAGASALLVINDKEDLDEMGCMEKDTSLNVSIPVLMISKSSGDALNRSMVEKKSGIYGINGRRSHV